MEPVIKIVVILVSLVGGGILTVDFIKNNDPMKPMVKLIIAIVSLFCGCLVGIVGLVVFVTITYIIGFYENTPGIGTLELIHFMLGLVIGLLITFFSTRSVFRWFYKK